MKRPEARQGAWVEGPSSGPSFPWRDHPQKTMPGGAPIESVLALANHKHAGEWATQNS
jgi:hypothetical protein